MKADPTSLDRLHDLVLPAPAPWWPPAPGWLGLLGFVVLAGLVLLLRGIIRWQKNRYRREALAEINSLEAAILGSESPRGRRSEPCSRPERGLSAAALPPTGRGELCCAALSEVLKRTAITAYPREQVASLTGTAWFAFLDDTAATSFSNGLGAALEQAVYHDEPARLEARQLQDLLQQSRQWIRRHDPDIAANASANHIGRGSSNTTTG